ncbi:hypothetical protein CR513_47018, partial [Mucuna pruriens]
MDPNMKLMVKHDEPYYDPERYRRLVGKLIYLTITRPDISFAVGVVSQFMQAPCVDHWAAVLRILRYIKKTPGQGLLYEDKGDTHISGYCDADWAGSPIDRRSTTGFCISIGGNVVFWKNKKQNNVARFNAEAEYRAMASATCELIWVKQLIQELKFADVQPMKLYCDNQATLHIASNLVFHERTKHIEIDCYFVREKLLAKEISTEFINSIQYSGLFNCDCTFFDAMLDLEASINVMSSSIYKSLNFSDLEPTGMTIQLVNRSVVQPLGVLENVLVQVNEIIFLTDFYMLDMEDKTSGKGSTLILGRPFLMTARTKIDVHVGTLSMEFAIKHPIEDHSLFGIDLIDELVKEHLQLNVGIDDTLNFAGDTNIFDCIGSVTAKADYDELWEARDLSNSEDDITDLTNLDSKEELLDLVDQVCSEDQKQAKAESTSANKDQKFVLSGSHSNTKHNAESDSNQTQTEYTPALSWSQQQKVEIISAHLVSNLNQVDHLDSKPTNDTYSSPPPPAKLKPLPSHLKYAYLDIEQQSPVIIANNLRREQEEKSLHVPRKHKKAIGWKLSDLPGNNASIYLHRILMEEEAHPLRLNLTILDMIKKEVTKLLAAGIIYLISDSQWVSPV